MISAPRKLWRCSVIRRKSGFAPSRPRSVDWIRSCLQEVSAKMRPESARASAMDWDSSGLN